MRKPGNRDQSEPDAIFTRRPLDQLAEKLPASAQEKKSATSQLQVSLSIGRARRGCKYGYKQQAGSCSRPNANRQLQSTTAQLWPSCSASNPESTLANTAHRLDSDNDDAADKATTMTTTNEHERERIKHNHASRKDAARLSLPRWSQPHL